MMAELCISVDDFMFFFVAISAIQQRTPQAILFFKAISAIQQRTPQAIFFFLAISAIQLRAPSLLDGGFVPLQLRQQRPRAPTTPAHTTPGREGLFCLVCVLVLVQKQL